MGQKTNPIGNRLGIIRGWESNWYGGQNFGDKLAEDAKIRKYLNVRLSKGSVSKIAIERTLKLVTITIHTARPGIIKKPELEATLVAESIARQIEGRISYKRAIKMSIASSMRMGAEGIKVQISGRLNGAEMARSEMYKDGRTPLHTFRADIDYSLAEAQTTYGLIGVKVWICRGEVYGKRDLMLHFKTPKKAGGLNQKRRK